MDITLGRSASLGFTSSAEVLKLCRVQRFCLDRPISIQRRALVPEGRLIKGPLPASHRGCPRILREGIIETRPLCRIHICASASASSIKHQLSPTPAPAAGSTSSPSRLASTPSSSSCATPPSSTCPILLPSATPSTTTSSGRASSIATPSCSAPIPVSWSRSSTAASNPPTPTSPPPQPTPTPSSSLDALPFLFSPPLFSSFARPEGDQILRDHSAGSDYFCEASGRAGENTCGPLD